MARASVQQNYQLVTHRPASRTSIKERAFCSSARNLFLRSVPIRFFDLRCQLQFFIFPFSLHRWAGPDIPFLTVIYSLFNFLFFSQRLDLRHRLSSSSRRSIIASYLRHVFDPTNFIDLITHSQPTQCCLRSPPPLPWPAFSSLVRPLLAGQTAAATPASPRRIPMSWSRSV